MDLVSAGDASAFEVIVDRHSGPAFSLAFRMWRREQFWEVQRALETVPADQRKVMGAGLLRRVHPQRDS